MARGRSPNRDKAFELWRESGAKRLLKDIAEELGVSETLVRKWKNQDKCDACSLLPVDFLLPLIIRCFLLLHSAAIM